MFGFKKKDMDSADAPKRGNLKFECFAWTLVAFAIVFFLLAGYDLLAKYWFDSDNVGKEGFVRFSYVHVGMLITFVAAVFSFLAIVVTAKVNETMNLHSFNLRYGEDKMLTAVRAIGNVERRWKLLAAAGSAAWSSPFDTPPCVAVRSQSRNDNERLHICNYAVFVSETDRLKPWSKEEDKARRIVKNYFSSALELYRCGGISKKTLRVICDIDAITLFFNVIETMEYITNEEYKFDVFHDLMSIVSDIYARKVKESEAHHKTSHFTDARTGSDAMTPNERIAAYTAEKKRLEDEKNRLETERDLYRQKRQPGIPPVDMDSAIEKNYKDDIADCERRIAEFNRHITALSVAYGISP